MDTMATLTPTVALWAKLLFAVLFITSLAVFTRRVLFLINCLKLGAQENQPRTDQPLRRIGGLFKFGFGQNRVLMFLGGVGHLFIFYGFLIISLATLEFIVNGFFPAVSFWRAFPAFRYIGAGVEGLSFLVLFAIGVSVIRRAVIRPVRLKGAAGGEAYLILGLIVTLILTYLFMTAQRIGAGEIPAGWAPLSYFFTQITPEVPFLGSRWFYWLSWWLHAATFLFFLSYIPYSKHLHILGAFPNLYLKSHGQAGRVAPFPFDLGDDSLDVEVFGVNAVEQFSWKQLLDTYACTECGRCQEQCPAFATGKALTPKGMIHDLKNHLFERGAALLKEGASSPDDIEKVKSGIAPALERNLIGDVFSEDFIWACTTCGACQRVCPVFIEHIQLIIDMRRYLVLTESKMPPGLPATMRNMENTSNPWGIGNHKRSQWAAGLDIPTFAENPDAEYLLYIGCAGSFDDASQVIATATAKILRAAGVTFAILGEEEVCCGETARRLGNEYLAYMLVTMNVETFKAYNIRKIITICPHCYNVLKNEYPQFGGSYQVWHHTEILKTLLDQHTIAPLKKPELGTVVWHDSCYLGRYNEIYGQPRGIIEAFTGSQAAEMPRHHALSFCCGAGGGRMWIEENEGTRINQHRTRMAIDSGADTICTACPYCRTMFVEGCNQLGVENIKCLDISQIIADSMGL